MNSNKALKRWSALKGSMLHNHKVLSILLSAILLVSCFSYSNLSVKAVGDLGFTFDLGGSGKVIENKFSELLVHNDFNSSTANHEPSDYFSNFYPFTEKVEIIDGTGGNDKQDLFIDPSDRTTLTDYKFDNLMISCRNIVRQGLKPYIVTGNVPSKFCLNPYISTSFNVNVRPPDDFDQYYIYIKAVAQAMVNEFGLDEVRTWSWGVLTEYENKNWFCAADGTVASTEIAYFKLYDYTVAALQDVVGADHLVIGAHGMVVAKGFWDVGDFIDHCGLGTNYKTGVKGTQINFLTTSYYDTKPGKFNVKSLDDCINQLRDRALADGLTNLKFGADEGRILNGADGKPITAREVGMSYQGAADARLFKDMIENDISWFAARAYNTGTIWGGVDTVSTHVANLGYKMTGDTYLTPAKTGSSWNSSDQVEGIGGYNSQTKTAHFMLYNFNPNPGATDSEHTTVTINNIGLIDGSTVTVKQWIVDDTHANFWPTWWQDMTDRGVDYSAAEWSMYSTTVPGLLKNQSDRDFWYANTPKYSALAELKSTKTNVVVENGSITLSPTLNHHAVIFYEITEKQAETAAQATLTDHLDNWSTSSSHSSDLVFSTSSSGTICDTSRVCRASSEASQAQYIVYKLNHINSFTATGLYTSVPDPLPHFKFYTSPDGINWTEQQGYTCRDVVYNALWTRRVYKVEGTPVSTNYMMVEFPTTGTYSWSPQLSQVTVTGFIYKPGDVNGDNAVDLMDVTFLGRTVAGWENLAVVPDELDRNGDAKIDLLDITLLSRYIAGWEM